MYPFEFLPNNRLSTSVFPTNWLQYIITMGLKWTDSDRPAVILNFELVAVQDLFRTPQQCTLLRNHLEL
jgi:hypothetical protein